MAKKSCSGCLVKVLIFFAVLALIALGIFNVFQRVADKKNTSSPGLFERKASLLDLNVSEEYSFPTSVAFEIYPKKDIDDLQLLLKYTDSNGAVLKTQVYALGDVSHGQKYSFEISLSDVGITNLLLLDNCYYYVCSGTVSLFG